MRLRHSDGSVLHLCYGTNVHPAEDLRGVIEQFDRYAVKVRERLGADSLGLGLWLARPAAAELAAAPAAVARLGKELAARGLEVVTLNGFPYESFHAPVVKYAVYLPDWAEPERLAYTLDLAEVLVGLLPGDAARGSISTLPLAWREPWTPMRRDTALRALDALGAGLAAIEDRTGRTVRVAIEPEPGCVIETITDAVEQLSGVDRRYIGVCLDLAHLAVAHERPTAALSALEAAELDVVKVQVSAALHAETPTDPDTQEALRGFAEKRFLHQTRELSPDSVRGVDDLSEALEGGLPGDGPWRIHFHVPIHHRPQPPLDSTVPMLKEALAMLNAGGPYCDHLEVETYTWEVLPPGLRPAGPEGLADGIAAELAFARGLLEAI
jgi:sugar phosphate isomerase/epimerase